MKLTAEAIAGLFGVEVGEEFLLNGTMTRVDDNGCVMMAGCKSWVCVTHVAISPNTEITKLPWKPKDGEKYFYPFPDPDKVFVTRFNIEFATDHWRLAHGLCFKTREEAEAKWRELYGVTG